MITTHFLAPWRKDLVINGFANEQPSMTVPDESYTIRQLVGMFASQMPPDLASYSDYDGEDPNYDDIDPLTQFGDLADYDAARLEQVEKVIVAKKKQLQLEEFLNNQKSKPATANSSDNSIVNQQVTEEKNP